MNGGRMLPLSNSKFFYPNDLTENAIQIDGEVGRISTNRLPYLFCLLKELTLES
jgi:hypothetical protein